MSQFVHLHLHTDYSMLDGACDVEKLCPARQRAGHARGGHDRPRQHFRRGPFLQRRQEAGIKPIIGCELYVCKKDDHNIERTPPEGDTYNHLLVLAENEEGYRNLVKITSEASLHGFYYKPRVSKAFLAEHSKGLIGLSGCLKGEVAERLTEEKYEPPARPPPVSATSSARTISFSRFRTRAWSRNTIHSGSVPVSKELGLPLVATNDCHYLCEDDAHAQDVMLCIQTGKSIQDTNRMKFQGTDFFVKSYEEMAARLQRRAGRADAHAGHRRALQPEAGESQQSFPALRCACRLHPRQLLRARQPRRLRRRLEALRVAGDQGRLKHMLWRIRTAAGARNLASSSR